MPYTPLTWNNDAVPSVSAVNLNHLETQYAQAVADAIPFRQGRVGYYRPPSTGGTATGSYAWAQDYMFAVPFIVGRTITFDRIAVHTLNDGGGTCNMRLGIYGTTNGAPGALVLDAGVLAINGAVGIKALTISQSLTPGLYWLAGAQGTYTGATDALSSIDVAFWVLPQGGITDTDFRSPPFGWVLRAFTYAALPDPWGTPVWQSGVMPIIALRSS